MKRNEININENNNIVKNLIIEDIGINGEGVAKDKENIYFVPFTLVGDVADVVVEKKTNKLCFCKLNKLKEKSPARIEPPCPYFTLCGGCDLQHIPYKGQLEIKRKNVEMTLSKMLGKIQVENCEASPKQFGYRNKIELEVKNNIIGFNLKNSHKIIEINNCLLCENWCQKIINILNYYINNVLIKNNLINKIIIRKNGENLMVVLVLNNKNIPGKNILIDLFKKEFNNFNLFYFCDKYNNFNSCNSENKLVCIYGHSTQKLNDFELDYEISPCSFMQVNDDMQTIVYNKIVDEIIDGQVVINAYSGAGFLSALLAKKSKMVYGIEIVTSASKNADKLTNENNLTNLVNINGDCSVEIPKLINKLKIENLSIVVDPPRKGIDSASLQAISNSGANKIVYLSCSPSTLARDLKVLAENYNLKLIKPFDMFPQTKHIETLVVLEKK